MFRSLLGCFVFLITWMLFSPAHALELSGEIKLTSGGRPLRPTEAADAVIYYRPNVKLPLIVPKQEALMTTERKRFLPGVLPIVIGSTVRFPNRDPILHNAFSTVANNAFDTDLYGKGEGGTHTFKNVGLVRVYCNVHHSMTATILVLDTPFFTKPDANGRFQLRGVPAGDGELFVWHERSSLVRKPLKITTDLTQVVNLDLNKRKLPPHLNKFGKPYRRAGAGEY